jgi:hypothetical protein
VTRRTARCGTPRHSREVSDEPVRILVQIGAAKASADRTDPDLVRRYVELVVRRAYPRVEVIVLWRKALSATRVHIVGGDFDHTETVRRIVDFVLARASRIATSVAE